MAVFNKKVNDDAVIVRLQHAQNARMIKFWHMTKEVGQAVQALLSSLLLQIEQRLHL